MNKLSYKKCAQKIWVKSTVDVNNTDGLTSTDLAVTEKEIILRDKENAPCKSYDEQFKESIKMLFSTNLVNPRNDKVLNGCGKTIR